MIAIDKKNTITDLRSVYTSKFLNMFEIHYKTKNGNNKKWIVATRKSEEEYKKIIFENYNIKNDAVIIVGYDESRDSVVIINEFRMSINDYIYSFPAGLIDDDEDYKETAIREMREETGLELYEIEDEKSCKKAFLSVGMTDESVAIVFGKVRGEISIKNQEDSEIIYPFYVGRERAKEILESNSNIDIKAWLILKNFSEGKI